MSNSRLFPIVGLALLLVAAVSFAAELTSEQEARYRTLVNELRCLVCQNQSLADSDAPLAQDLREQVQARIAAGKSNAEITAYLTDRYGDFVLYRPPFKARTWLLWLGPFALLLVAGSVVLVFLRRSRSTPPPANVDPAELKRLLDEEP